MVGRFDLKVDLIVWTIPSDNREKVASFDVVVERSGNGNSKFSFNREIPAKTFWTHLLAGDREIFQATKQVLAELVDKLVDAEEIHLKRPTTVENVGFLIENVAKLLEYYATMFQSLQEARNQEEQRRQSAGSLPAKMLEACSGNLISSSANFQPQRENYENSLPKLGETISSFSDRVQDIVARLRKCVGHLKANQLHEYRTEAETVSHLADLTLTDIEIVSDVAFPSVTDSPEEAAGKFLERFRKFNDGVYTERGPGLVQAYREAVLASQAEEDNF